jgi:hypothetical protein
VELEVEQPTVGRLEGMGAPAEVDGGSTIEMEGVLMFRMQLCKRTELLM